MERNQHCWVFACLLAVLLWIGPTALHGADTLSWNTNLNRVAADVTSVPLLRLLEGVSQLTGWQVYLESNATRNVSAKFQDLPSGEALRALLGNLNFALVPTTNARPRLYVFHTMQDRATMLVQPGSLNGSTTNSSRLSNELVITLKPGAKIENLACLQAGQVVGRIDGLNTYRIKLTDADAAEAARLCLAGNPDVESIDSNFAVDRPEPGQQLNSNAAADFDLKLKESSGDCKVIVAVLDTAGMDSVPADLSKFLLPTISVTDDGTSAPKSASAELTHGLAMVETLLRGVQATTSGNTSVKVLPVNVYGNNVNTTTFEVTQGIYRAVNSGANVVNMSLGSTGNSTALHNLIRKASEQGVLFFGAAGNEPVTSATYPAAYPEVVAVTAGDHNGQLASYANRGNFVDIMTPGTSVVPFNGQSYIVSGTSAATAYASGLAAGLADANQVCPPEVVSTMKSRLGVQLGQ